MYFQSHLLFLNLGVPELSIIVLLVLILFGPGKLPGVMKALGEGVKQFKDSSNGIRVLPAEAPKPEETGASSTTHPPVE